MRVIIAGGSGTIGRRLAKQLGADGYDVVILSRNPERSYPRLPSGVRAVQWDAKTPQGWSHLLDHPDTSIVNLAGESIANWRWTDEHKRRVLQSRIETTQALVDAIDQSEYKPNVLVQASAVGYYGDGGNRILHEDDPPSREWRAQVCVEWEAVAKKAKTRTVLSRIGIVLSPHGGALPAFVQAANLLGSRLGSGNQWIPWIHIDDVCYSLRFLMNHSGASGPFNIVAPEPVRNRDFMSVVAQVRGRPAFIPVPSFALYLALGEQALFVLDSQRVTPDKLLEAGYEFHYPELRDALRDLLKHGHHWRQYA